MVPIVDEVLERCCVAVNATCEDVCLEVIVVDVAVRATCVVDVEVSDESASFVAVESWVLGSVGDAWCIHVVALEVPVDEGVHVGLAARTCVVSVPVDDGTVVPVVHILLVLEPSSVDLETHCSKKVGSE